MNDDSMNAAAGILRSRPLYRLLYRHSKLHMNDRDIVRNCGPDADICQTESNDKINLFSWDIGLPSTEVQKAQTKTGM